MARSRVYRNLNNGKWSIKQKIGGKWVVVGHCDACVLFDVSPYVSAKTRARMIALLPERGREVHAWLEGWLAEVSDFVSYRGREVEVTGNLYGYVVPEDCCARITYHPFDLSHEGFHYVTSGSDVTYAECAWFNSAHQVWAA